MELDEVLKRWNVRSDQARVIRALRALEAAQAATKLSEAEAALEKANARIKYLGDRLHETGCELHGAQYMLGVANAEIGRLKAPRFPWWKKLFAKGQRQGH